MTQLGEADPQPGDEEDKPLGDQVQQVVAAEVTLSKQERGHRCEPVGINLHHRRRAMPVTMTMNNNAINKWPTGWASIHSSRSSCNANDDDDDNEDDESNSVSKRQEADKKHKGRRRRRETNHYQHNFSVRGRQQRQQQQPQEQNNNNYQTTSSRLTRRMRRARRKLETQQPQQEEEDEEEIRRVSGSIWRPMQKSWAPPISEVKSSNLCHVDYVNYKRSHKTNHLRELPARRRTPRKHPSSTCIDPLRATMLPGWRQVTLVGLLLVVATSLLASLDHQLAPCNGLLFSHCEAVQVSASQGRNSSPVLSTKKDLQHQPKPPAGLTIEELQQISSNSNNKPTYRPEVPPTTTSPTTATLSAPMTTSSTSNSQSAFISRSTNSTGRASARQTPPQLERLFEVAPREQQVAEDESEWRLETAHNNTNYNNIDRQQQQQQQTKMQMQSNARGDNKQADQIAIVVGRRPSNKQMDVSPSSRRNYSAAAAADDDDENQQRRTNISSSNSNFVPIKSDNNNNQIGQAQQRTVAGEAIKLIESPNLFPSTTTTNQQQTNWSSSSSSFSLQARPTPPPPLQAPSSGWTIDSDSQLLSGQQQNHSLDARPPESARQQQQRHLQESSDSMNSNIQAMNEIPTSTPIKATTRHRQREPNSVIENAVREAIGDLMASAAGEPIYASNGGSGGLTSHLPLIDMRQFDINNDVRLQQQPMMLGRQYNQQPLVPTGSASAPSVSLPPLSHLLSPRNPFRLFASSSSTPMATRYFPVLVNPKNRPQQTHQDHQSQHQQQQQQQRLSIGRWLSGSPLQLREQMQSLASKITPTSSVGGHSQSSTSSPPLPPMPPFPSFSDMANVDLSASSGRVYAHSHSAEQLERLVRAAAQAGHLPAPPILPAIVSGPGGQTIAGFYIPAVDGQQPTTTNGNQHSPVMGASSSNNHQQQQYAGQQQDNRQESQVSEFRHQSADGGGPSMASKIPGTDYILHTDEVRAMMNIGELAWRRQRQQASASEANEQTQQAAAGVKGPQSPSNSGHQASASTTVNNYNRPQWSFNGEEQQQPQQPPVRPFGLMRENHAENVRDYAFVESNRRAREYLQSSQSSNRQQRLRHEDQQQQNAPPFEPAANSSSSSSSSAAVGQFDGQLVGQLAQQVAKSKVFPAIIRVNNQDYVHWPLIQIVDTNRQSASPGEPFNSMAATNNQQVAPPMFRGPYMQSTNNFRQYQPAQGQQHHHQRQPAMMGQESKLENSSVRLATQLTPNEIRQVEDSILETLIMAQTMQHQRKIMQAMAAANQPTYAVGPNQQNNNNNNYDHSRQQQENKFKTRFFSRTRRRRRRRRNSANNNNNNQPQQQHQQQHMSALSTRQHFLDMLPLSIDDNQLAGLTVDPITMHPLDVDASAHVMESKVSHRLPVLLADQHTNQQPKSQNELDHQMGKLSVDSTNPKVSIASPLDLPQVFGNRVVQLTAARGDDLSKGRRVSNAVSRPSSIRNQQQVVAFVPVQDNRSRQLSLYQAVASQAANQAAKQQQQASNEPQLETLTNLNQAMKSSETQIDASNSVRAPKRPTPAPTRINVDWPGMVSDADYFPHKPHDGPARQQKQTSINKLRPKQAYNKDGPDEEEPEEEMRRNKQRLAENQATRVNNENTGQQTRLATGHSVDRPTSQFVTSQLKLQFAQDYQAREGVPIYNNNVRVAGALDRQRSLQAAETPKHLQASPSSSSSNESDDDESDPNDGDEPPMNDLDKGASLLEGVKTPSNSQQDKATSRLSTNQSRNNQAVKERD